MHLLQAAIEDLLSHQPWTVVQAMEQHFGPDFRQRVQGSWVDRQAFAARMQELRAQVEHVTITVLDEIKDNDRYAERHIIDLRMRDGERVVREVFVFARLDPDGRFHRMEESTLLVDHQPKATNV